MTIDIHGERGDGDGNGEDSIRQDPMPDGHRDDEQQQYVVFGYGSLIFRVRSSPRILYTVFFSYPTSYPLPPRLTTNGDRWVLNSLAHSHPSLLYSTRTRCNACSLRPTSSKRVRHVPAYLLFLCHLGRGNMRVPATTVTSGWAYITSGGAPFVLESYSDVAFPHPPTPYCTPGGLGRSWIPQRLRSPLCAEIARPPRYARSM
jgi:hypothetical protein